jgi:predicted RNase H-like HicB family nuclease
LKNIPLKFLADESCDFAAYLGLLTQGETMQELTKNLHDAIEGCLSIEMGSLEIGVKDKIMEIAV